MVRLMFWSPPCGGDTGAVYHLYSDQPIESSSYSPSPIPAAPQIAYGNDLIFQSGSTQAYAPAPRTLTAAVEEEIRRHRFIALAQSTDSTLAAHPLTYIGSTLPMEKPPILPFVNVQLRPLM